MRNKRVTEMTQAAMIAALYVALTMLANALGLANYAVQLRFSEALCILPYFTFAAVPGLSVGCLLANLLTGAAIWDIIFGSLATFLGAVGSYLLRSNKYLLTLPPVIANTVIIPLVLHYAYGLSWEYGGVDYSLPYFAVTVGVGECLSVCIFGGILLKVLLPYKNIIFSSESK